MDFVVWCPRSILLLVRQPLQKFNCRSVNFALWRIWGASDVVSVANLKLV